MNQTRASLACVATAIMIRCATATAYKHSGCVLYDFEISETHSVRIALYLPSKIDKHIHWSEDCAVCIGRVWASFQ
jgi:hypothetical protein